MFATSTLSALVPGTTTTYVKDSPLNPPESLINDLTTKDDILARIDELARINDLNADLMKSIVACESGFKPDIQSNFYHNGVRENSWGLVQINLSAHPYITKEQAIDPNFALNFLATQMKNGNAKIWSCYHIMKDKI